MYFKKLLTSFLLSSFILLPGTIFAQVNSAMIQKARSMGISQSQIDAAMSQSGEGVSGGNSTRHKVSYSNIGVNSSSGRDTSSRVNLTMEDLEQINPVSLEKVISDKIDNEYRSVHPDRSDTQSYVSDVEEYEIVIKNGQYIKRPLPVIFGREIFSNRNLTFEPSYTLATPPDYVLGAEDEVIIEVWGTSELYAQEKISPDGTIYIEGVGPISLGGLTVSDAQKRVKAAIDNTMGGANVNLSLGRIRSIKVNIAGEVSVPGTYTLPSLATLFNALYSAGGVNRIGSLRSVKVYRNNKQIADLDVYDYLINGIYDTNIRLEDNDMIIVSPYDNYVTIYGQIKRERTYELKKGETLEDLIKYAGGFKGDAYSENVTVKRKTGRQYKLFTADKSEYSEFVMNDGDSVAVGRVINEYSNKLVIEGAVWRPGEYELSDDVNTLSKLIEKAEGLKGNEFASRGRIIRRKSDYTQELIPFNVRDVALKTQDIALQAEDSVYIPTILELREDYTVQVRGEVNKEDTLPYRSGMTVEDVIIMSGGLKESASLAKIEVARRVSDPNATSYTPKTAEIFTFDISKDLQIAPEDKRFVLYPFDEVYVRRSPGYSEQQRVTVSGEVLFGGTYVLATAGERISDVIAKTGGITPEAYIQGASVRRRMSDDERIKMEAIMSVMQRNAGKDSIDMSSVTFPEYYPVGVDIANALENPGCIDDIILQDGDQILVPKNTNTVKISGSVLYSNTVTYNSDRLKDYISQAGGYNTMARKRPFIIYMNGKVASTKRVLFWKRYPNVEPGCEIVVPMKPPRDGSGLATTMGILSSTTSMAALIATMITNLK